MFLYACMLLDLPKQETQIRNLICAYIAQEICSTICLIEIADLLAGYNLKNQDTKTIYIKFMDAFVFARREATEEDLDFALLEDLDSLKRGVIPDLITIADSCSQNTAMGSDLDSIGVVLRHGGGGLLHGENPQLQLHGYNDVALDDKRVSQDWISEWWWISESS
ncbi:hypothetical protein LWI28_009146 [Acer negundo]|uniref:Uncharacterized protein n=1 Tax=Acer negundo TaxID=4023 RepID=A0AAD5J487_ACENE|nr:hypothetical protein LWI28_009146 [Acer negundo]